jgi:hypothetical protein
MLEGKYHPARIIIIIIVFLSFIVYTQSIAQDLGDGGLDLMCYSLFEGEILEGGILADNIKKYCFTTIHVVNKQDSFNTVLKEVRRCSGYYLSGKKKLPFKLGKGKICIICSEINVSDDFPNFKDKFFEEFEKQEYYSKLSDFVNKDNFIYELKEEDKISVFFWQKLNEDGKYTTQIYVDKINKEHFCMKNLIKTNKKEDS